MITKGPNCRIRDQSINLSANMKYLRVIFNKHFYPNVHINNQKPKLHRGIGLIAKITKLLLKLPFNSHLICAYQIWGQAKTVPQQLKSKQHKAIWVINTKPHDYPANGLDKTNKILNICDYVKLENYLLVKEVITKTAFDMFEATLKDQDSLINTTPGILHNTRSN